MVRPPSRPSCSPAALVFACAARPPCRTDLSRQREVVDAFLAASRVGDFDALVALLDPDVVLRADLGPTTGGSLAAGGRGRRGCQKGAHVRPARDLHAARARQRSGGRRQLAGRSIDRRFSASSSHIKRSPQSTFSPTRAAGPPRLTPRTARDRFPRRPTSRGGRPASYDAADYKNRNVVERCFNRLKGWRGLATLYDKHAVIYRGAVVLAAIMLWLPRRGRQA